VQSSKWTVNAGATYTQPIADKLDGYLSADVGFKSGIYGYIDESPYSRIDGYAVVNLRAGVTYDKYDLSVWVRNTGDARYYYQVITAATGSGGYVAIPAEPRMFGVRLRASL
jgi:iron complex outermembrane receptor protein